MADSGQRVALELLDLISRYEPGDKTRDRAYFLTLYNQCLSVVNGADASRVLAQR
jgi:hypothetical protein